MNRKLLGGLLVLAVAAAAGIFVYQKPLRVGEPEGRQQAVPAGSPSETQALTIVSWGGSYTKSQVEAFHKPYAAETGVVIRLESYDGGLAEVRAQVKSGSVSWDLVDFDLADIVRGCEEGLLEPLDLDALPASPDGTPAQDDFIAGTLHKCGVATMIWSTVFAYDANAFPFESPTSLADFFDVERFPGKRGMQRSPKANLEFALMADGVAPNKVYEVLATPEGADRAFAKLDSIKEQVIWWESGSQPPQLLSSGEVTMTTAYNGRIFNAQVRENKPFVIVWDGQVWHQDLWGIPRGSKNKEAAMEFVKFSTTTQRLAAQSSWISYGPARKSSIPFVGKHAEAGIEMAPHTPTAPQNFRTAVQNDFEFWSDYYDELSQRFAAWLAGTT